MFYEKNMFSMTFSICCPCQPKMRSFCQGGTIGPQPSHTFVGRAHENDKLEKQKKHETFNILPTRPINSQWFWFNFVLGFGTPKKAYVFVLFVVAFCNLEALFKKMYFVFACTKQKQ